MCGYWIYFDRNRLILGIVLIVVSLAIAALGIFLLGCSVGMEYAIDAFNKACDPSDPVLVAKVAEIGTEMLG